MTTERHRPERRAARIMPGSAGTAVRRLFLLGVFVFLGWCGLALVSGATASAADQPGSAPAHRSSSSSLLGTSTVGDVLDEATSAVRSVGNRPFDIVTVQQDRRSAPAHDAVAAGAGRTRDGATDTGTDPAGHPVDGTDRSVLDLVSVPVRGLADPGAGVPVDIAVSAVDQTLGHVAGAPLRSVTGGLVTPLDATVTRAATSLAVVRGVVSTRHDAVAAPETGRAGIRLGAPAHAATDMAGAPAPVATPGDATATELRAGLPAGGHHTPSAPAAGDAPAMPLGVAGGSASGGSGGSAGAAGTYLDFAGVRPSAASGPVWTVRQNDEQVPLDNPDRPRVSPD